MPDPRWLVDGMLGRLARYLRFMGYDTEYARDVPDPELTRRSRAEERILVTRDRGLARATPHAVLLTEVTIRGQLRELASARPGLIRPVVFERCSLCNGPVRPRSESELGSPGSHERWERGAPAAIFRCGNCGQEYWEGSHTARIRRTLDELAREAA